MEIRLLPPNDQLINTSAQEPGFIYRQYLLNDQLFYFTLHPELYPEGESLDFTGRYLAVVTSIRGLETFYLVPTENGFTTQSEAEETTEDFSAVDEELNRILRQEDDLEETEQPEQEAEESREDESEDPDSETDWIYFDTKAALLPLMYEAILAFRAGK